MSQKRVKPDPDVRHIRAVWRAFNRLSDDAKEPTLRWMNDRFFSEKAAKARACRAEAFVREQRQRIEDPPTAVVILS